MCTQSYVHTFDSDYIGHLSENSYMYICGDIYYIGLHLYDASMLASAAAVLAGGIY